MEINIDFLQGRKERPSNLKLVTEVTKHYNSAAAVILSRRQKKSCYELGILCLDRKALLLYVSRKQEGEMTLPVKEPFYWLKVSFHGTFESIFCKLLRFEFLNTGFKSNN